MTLEQKIVEVLTKIEQGLLAQGPEAMRLLLTALQVQAALAVAGLIVGLVVLWLVWRMGLRQWWAVQYDDTSLTENARFGRVACTVLYAFAAVTMALVTVVVGSRAVIVLIDPRLGLALRLLEKIR